MHLYANDFVIAPRQHLALQPCGMPWAAGPAGGTAPMSISRFSAFNWQSNLRCTSARRSSTLTSLRSTRDAAITSSSTDDSSQLCIDFAVQHRQMQSCCLTI